MNPNSSPSGPAQPIAVFSTSAPIAFLAGVGLNIAFDRVDLLQGEGIGPINIVPGITLTPGVYFAECQLELDSAPTLVSLFIAIGSGSAADGARTVNPTDTVDARPTVSMTAVRLVTETPLSPTIFASCSVNLLATVAGGNIVSSRLLIMKLADSPGIL